MKKPNIFLDTNIVLDLLGERLPFYDSAAKIASLADKGELTLFVSALSYATVNYLLVKYEDAITAREKLRKFKIISEITDLTAGVIEKGLSSGFRDFEDSLQYYCALEADCDVIVSRNGKDFAASTLPVMSPDEFLSAFRKQ